MAVSHVKSNTVADWTGTVTVGNSTGGTQTVNATDLVRPGDWNSAHNQFYTLSGNTSNASTASGTNVVLAATGNITLAGSTGTIWVSAPPSEILSTFQNVPILANMASAPLAAGSSNLVFPMLLHQDGSFSYIRLFMSVSGGYNTFTTATGAAGYGGSAGQSNTLWVNIYTVGAGASSRSLQYLTQASTSWAQQYSYSGTASTHSVSHNFTFPSEGGVSSSTQLTSSAQSSAVNEMPAGTANFIGNRFIDMPFATSLSAGNYFIALQRSSASGSNSGAEPRLNLVPVGVSMNTSTFAFPNVASNSSYQQMPYLGSWSTNSRGATTSSIARANVSTVASNIIPIVQFIREA